MRSAIWLAFASGFVGMAYRTGFGVLYPGMVADQGWSVGEITGAFSLAMLLYSPAAVLAGEVADRRGVRVTMLFGTTLLAGGLALVAVAEDIWQVYVLWALAGGPGTAAVGFVPMIKLLSLRAGRRLGLAIGLFNVGQGVGALVSSPLLQLMSDQSGWRAGFFSLGGAVLLVMAPLAILGAPGRAESQHPSSAPHVVPTSSLWREPTFWLVVAANASMGYLLLLPAHHVAHLVLVGLPGLLAATAGGLMGACVGLGAVVGGWATDHWGAGRLSLLGATLMCFGVLALLASGPSMLWLVGIYVFFGGMGRGILGVNVATFQARAFAGPTLGRVTGLLDLGFGLGAFGGPYLTALARDQTGSYVAGLATAIFAGLIAALCLQVARRGVAREALRS